MSENIVPPIPSGPDLTGSVQPADSTAGRSDPKVVPMVLPVPKKSPILLFISLVLLSIVSVFAIYLFLQVRTLTLEKTSPTPSPSSLAIIDPTANWETFEIDGLQLSFRLPDFLLPAETGPQK